MICFDENESLVGGVDLVVYKEHPLRGAFGVRGDGGPFVTIVM